MEERQLKRLLIIVAVSIAIIMAFKMMLTDSLTTMNQAAAEKKHATPAPQPAIEPPVLLEPVFFPPEPVAAPAGPEEPDLPQTEITGVPDATVGDEPAVMGDEGAKMDAPASSNVSTNR
jgi:hypothetical protein